MHLACWTAGIAKRISGRAEDRKRISRISCERVERIHVSGNRYGPVQLLLHGSAKGLRRGRVAVHQIKLLWRRGETGEPANQFGAISVRGKLTDFRNF